MEPGLIRYLKEQKGAGCHQHWSLAELVHKENGALDRVFLLLS